MVVNVQSLDQYKSPEWYAQDRLIEDKNYTIYVYNIVEYHMGAYAGNIAICRPPHEKPILNTGNMHIAYDIGDFYKYFELSDCLVFTMLAYNEESSKPDRPFLLIKPNTRKFSFIEWDYTSRYYSFDELNEDILILREMYSRELDSRKIVKRTGEQFNISLLKWYDFDDFTSAKEIYLNS